MFGIQHRMRFLCYTFQNFLQNILWTHHRFIYLMTLRPSIIYTPFSAGSPVRRRPFKSYQMVSALFSSCSFLMLSMPEGSLPVLHHSDRTPPHQSLPDSPEG